MTGIGKLYPNTKYLVAYVADSISVMNEQKRSDIENMLYAIGEEVGELAGVIIPPRGKENENIERFKQAHQEFYESRVQDELPCLLVVEDDFANFDYNSCRWAVIGISNLFDQNGHISMAVSEGFTRDFIASVKSNRSIFDNLYDMEIDENRKRLLRSFEMKPGIFGFSIDIKHFFSLSAPSTQD